MKQEFKKLSLSNKYRDDDVTTNRKSVKCTVTLPYFCLVDSERFANFYTTNTGGRYFPQLGNQRSLFNKIHPDVMRYIITAEISKGNKEEQNLRNCALMM